jgi:hypothetical protein
LPPRRALLHCGAGALGSKGSKEGVLRDAAVTALEEDGEGAGEKLKRWTSEEEWARLARSQWPSVGGFGEMGSGVSVLEGHDLETGRAAAGRGALFGRSNGAEMLFGRARVAQAAARRRTPGYKRNGGNLVAFGDFEFGLSANAHNPLNPTNFPFARDAQDEAWRRRAGMSPREPAYLDFMYLYGGARKKFTDSDGAPLSASVAGIHKAEFFNNFEERMRSSGLVKTDPHPQDPRRHIKRTTARRQTKRAARHYAQRAAVRRLLWIIDRKKRNEENFVDAGELPMDVLVGTELQAPERVAGAGAGAVAAAHDEEGDDETKAEAEAEAEHWWQWAQPGGAGTKSLRMADLGFAPDDLSQTDDDAYSKAWHHRLRQRRQRFQPKMRVVGLAADHDDGHRFDDRVANLGEDWGEQYAYPESEMLYPKAMSN